MKITNKKIEIGVMGDTVLDNQERTHLLPISKTSIPQGIIAVKKKAEKSINGNFFNKEQIKDKKQKT